MRGWGLVGGYAIAMTLWAVAVLVVVEPVGESLPMVMRGTARGSFALFWAGFAAPAFGASSWLRRNAGYLFVTLAASHLLHAIAIVSLAVLTGGQSLGGRIDLSHLGGLVTYLVILAVALGYTFRGGREPERRGWIVAQEIGLHYVWLSFVLAYVGKSMDGATAFWPVAALAIAAGLLRWIGRSRRGG